MNDDQRTLKQLILEGMYVVDEESVARAIVARAGARTAVARTSFHSDQPKPKLSAPRAFRRYPRASSLRLVRSDVTRKAS